MIEPRNHQNPACPPPGAGALTLAAAVAAMNGPEGTDAAVEGLTFALDGHRTVVPEVYYEPLLPSDRLRRGQAAQLLDTAARACADAQGLGTRLAVITAHRIRSRLAFQRLGYRTDADYAREELRMTPRAFRDLARLGERLEALPRVRRAFLEGTLTRTQAEVIGGIATASDEDEWLAAAKRETVRGLKAAARVARESLRGGSPGDDGGLPVPDSARVQRDGSAPSGGALPENVPPAGAAPSSEAPGSEARAGGARETDRVARRSFDVPPAMLGKIDRVLRFAARVAGADLPPGAAWELVAAEFLSGIPSETGTSGAPEDREDGEDGEGRPLPAAGEGAYEGTTSAATPPGPAHPPEDPRGYQVWLEEETRRWPWLPTARPALEAHGDWRRLRERCLDDEPRTAWQLHDEMIAALTAERRVAWQLGRLLGMIRNRNLWRDMWFASFSHYVRERLGISSRVADRLIRIDRDAWAFPALRRAWDSGVLTPLQAEALVRTLRRVERDEQVQQAWIDFAKRATLEHFDRVARAAEQVWQETPPARRRGVGTPRQVERFEPGARDASPMFVTRYDVWMTDGEFEVLQRAIACVAERIGATIAAPIGPAGGHDHATTDPVGHDHATIGPAGGHDHATIRPAEGRDHAIIGPAGGQHPPTPTFVCLDILLDEFVHAYEDLAQSMRSDYPLFDRDEWQCRAPGCRSHGPLHLHHIVFRAHGGGDEPDNLVTLCDFHHKALHDGWIRCVGRAPGALYWELGLAGDGSTARAVAPVARVAGNLRLRDDEYWDGAKVQRLVTKATLVT